MAMSSVKVEQLSLIEQHELKMLLEQGYGLAAEISLCRGVYLLKTDLGELVLKRLRTGTSRTYLIGKLLEQSPKAGLLPQLIATKYGGSYFFRNGNRYLLTTKLPGREADYLEFGDFLVALQGMRALHEQAEKLIAADSCWQWLTFSVIEVWQQRLQELVFCRKLAQRKPDEFGKRYLKWWLYFYTQASLALTLWQKYRGSRLPTLCYHDWACHNVLIKQGRAALFDFEYLILDSPVHDQANLLGKYLRLHDYRETEFARMMQALREYYPWQPREIELLQAYLTFPYDYWILGRQYYLEWQPWAQSYYQMQWQRKIAVEPKRAMMLRLLRDF